MNTTRHPKRPASYWAKLHPHVTAVEGLNPHRALADIARDHPDWTDEAILARLEWEVGEATRIRPIVSECLPRD